MGDKRLGGETHRPPPVLCQVLVGVSFPTAWTGFGDDSYSSLQIYWGRVVLRDRDRKTGSAVTERRAVQAADTQVTALFQFGD